MEAHCGQVLNIASPETYLSYHLHFGGLCSQRKLLPGCFSAFLSSPWLPLFSFGKRKKASFILQKQSNYRHPLNTHLCHRGARGNYILETAFHSKAAASTLLMARKTHGRWVWHHPLQWAFAASSNMYLPGTRHWVQPPRLHQHSWFSSPSFFPSFNCFCQTYRPVLFLGAIKACCCFRFHPKGTSWFLPWDVIVLL